MRLGDSRRRLTVSFAAVASLALILGGRLVQVQGLDGHAIAQAAEQQRLRTSDLEAQRGQIDAADGQPLAYSVEADTIFADPKLIVDPFATAQQIAPYLGVSAATLQPLMVQPNRFDYLAHGVDPDVAAKILALNLPGIATLPEPKRVYPGGALGASVVGFTDRAGHGRGGVEEEFDKQLAGTPGQLTVEVGGAGEVIPAGVHERKQATPGASVRLTIDRDLQYVAQQELAKAVRGAGAKDGDLTILDVHTGRVVAMASYPSYNAQDPGATPQLLSNPAVSVPFEPGSVNKVVAFTAALEHHLITPATRFTVPGQIEVAPGVSVHDAWVHGDATWTAAGILAKSSNVGTLMIAKKVGPGAWMNYAKKFGEGQATGVGLPGESAGLLPERSHWSSATFGNLPIGQGVSMTTLQLASIYQAIADNGVRIPPRIVASITSAGGKVSTPSPPHPIAVMRPSTSATLRTMLQQVSLEGGTGRRADIPGYNVAGKTGTGQQYDTATKSYSDTNYWSTFAGFAPSDAPKYVMSIMVDTPQHAYEGGDVAAPLFHDVMSYALAHGQVPPTGKPATVLPQWWGLSN